MEAVLRLAIGGCVVHRHAHNVVLEGGGRVLAVVQGLQLRKRHTKSRLLRTDADVLQMPAVLQDATNLRDSVVKVFAWIGLSL